MCVMNAFMCNIYVCIHLCTHTLHAEASGKSPYFKKKKNYLSKFGYGQFSVHPLRDCFTHQLINLFEYLLIHLFTFQYVE